jgi:hypothetical protein
MAHCVGHNKQRNRTTYTVITKNDLITENDLIPFQLRTVKDEERSLTLVHIRDKMVQRMYQRVNN